MSLPLAAVGATAVGAGLPIAAGASTGGDLDGVAGWAVSLMETLGGPGAGIAIALENLFPPLPSEVILPLAGFTASRGDMSLVSAIVWTTVGSLVGALVLYYLGALLGRRRMRLIAVRVPLIKVDDVDRAEAWFDRHGTKAVFFGRMIPLFRSFISIPAGIERMRLSTFVLYTTLGSLVWNVIFVMAGYVLGENWHLVERYADPLQKLVIGVLVLAAAWFVVNRVVRERPTRRRG